MWSGSSEQFGRELKTIQGLVDAHDGGALVPNLALLTSGGILLSERMANRPHRPATAGMWAGLGSTFWCSMRR
jgi:hypothetical protein